MALDEVAIYNRALDAGEIYYLVNPLENSIDKVQLRFRHAGGNVWPALAPDGIKLYLSMDNDPIADNTPFAQDVTCAGGCPEQELGWAAFAARFDGVDDRLQVANFLDPADGPFSAAVWFNLDDLSAKQAVLQQQGGQTWLGVGTAGKLYTELGESTLESSESVTTSVWHHAALTFDGDTLTLYLDGDWQASGTPSIAASDGDLLLGVDTAAPTYLSGALDEVLVYDRALADTEIELLATESPWFETSLTSRNSDTRTFADWFYEDPIPQIEGMYAIDLWAVDGLDNVSYIPNAWVGVIDTIGPHIVLTHTEISDFVSQISCEATDFNLDDASFICPATGDMTYGYQDADWYTQITSGTDELASSSIDTDKLFTLSSDSQNKLVAGDYSLTACDLFDNCTSVTAFIIKLFEDANAGLPGTYGGDAHWGDYDNDGDLDILVTGCPDKNSCDSPLAEVYANEAGGFSPYASLTGQSGGGSAWGDYDNDGDLDIVISGRRGSAAYETTLYENTGSGFSASETISGGHYGQVAWGDFDNDLDLLIEGALYQNNGGVFSAYASLTSQIKDYAAWGDYDNDGDLDLLIDGQVYNNDDANFGLNYDISLSTYRTDAQWGDYDNDGDLDLLMGGYNFSEVYENEAGTFSRAYRLDTGFYQASVAWGDYDADGLLDILVSGKSVSSNAPQLDIYRNTGDGFELVQTLDGVTLGGAEWGDYDNDGYPDILLNGCASNNCDSLSSIVYQNRLDVGNASSTNTAPTAPSGLNDIVSGLQVTLTWGTATDAETPDAALRYNLTIGSAADQTWAKSPMAVLSGTVEGWQLRPGQTGLVSTTINLNLERPGDYVWSVQAVDGAFAGSTWATQGSFHIEGADLAISKQVDSTLAQGGDSVEYTLVFTNNVGDTVTDAVITDTIPLGLTNLSYQSGGIGVTRVGSTNYAWDVADIAEGESGTITVSGQINGVFESGQFIANVAQIGSAAYDNDLENNEAGAMTYSGSGTVCTNYESAVLADNPEGYWRLSEAASVADNLGSTGSAVDGAYVGALPTTGLLWQDPTLGARFDGVDDYILIPNHPDLTGETTVKTIELWFKADADLGAEVSAGSSEYMLYEQGGNGQNGLNLFIRSIKYSDGSMKHQLAGSVASSVESKSYVLATISADTVYHVVLIYQDSMVTAYLDGVQISSRGITGSQLNEHNDGDIRIGANGGTFIVWNTTTALLPFPGVIDEVAVYNSALGVDRVAAHYSACQAVDMAVSKSAAVSQVEAGGNVTYTLGFANAGYETASNVVISDTLPSELINSSATWTADNGVSLSQQVSGNSYQWTASSLPGGAGGVITVSAQISSSVEPNTQIENTVSIGTSSEEFNTANNTASAKVNVMEETVAPPDPTFVLDDDASGDLQNVYLGSVDWGDYDADGDLDLVMNGHSGVYRLARVYRNDDGRFTNINAGLPGVQDGSVDWGDYDGDGYLDILITGSAGSSRVARVYHNDGGDSFSNIGAGLVGVYKGNAEWGDYDDDGDLDILVTGHTGTNPDSRVYRNDPVPGGHAFTNIGASLFSVYLSSSTWADYDHDGDLDILISGVDSGDTAVTALYRNNGSDPFVLLDNTGLPALYDTTSSAIAWGDYDNDTDLDLLLSGNTSGGDIAAVYRNNGDDTFSDIGAGLPGLNRGSVAWGDYDGDGYLDILLAGSGLDQASVYANDGSGGFDVLAYEILPPLINGDVAWGDYDDDGALDILLTGQSGANTLSQIWRNTSLVLRLGSGSYSVDEDAGFVTIDVLLNESSTEGDVTVDYASTDGSALAGSDYVAVSGTLTILSDTLGSSFDVSITDDALLEGNETLTLSLRNPTGAPSRNGVGLGYPYTATLTIVDDDTTPGVTVTPTSVSVTEGGATDSYQVVLDSQPADDVIITIDTDGQTGVSPTALTFGVGDWGSTQSVTVTAVDDGLIEGIHSGVISHTASSADLSYDGINIGDVSATIADNDSAGVVVTPTNVSVTEGGATGSYDVVLTSQPSATVAITVAADAQVTADPTSLTFSTLDWDVAQSVTVTAVDDSLIEGLHSGTISHTAASADADYDGISIDDVSAAITDNDEAGVDISPTSINVTEGVGTASYQVALTAQPTDTVTISVITDSQTSVDSTSLVFTAITWSDIQTVTVTAVDDDLIEGQHSGVISHTADSTDTHFTGISVSAVNVDIADNDSAGVSVLPGTVSIGEDGTTDSYQIVLTTQPTATVIISVITDSQTSVTSNTLTFSTTNWDITQTVTVSAVDDDIVEGSHEGYISHTVSSSDGNYDEVGVSGVSATISDDDTAGVTVTPTSVSVAEGGASDTYDVVLTSEPTATVTIDVNTDGQTSVDPVALTFLSGEWDITQTVTVDAVVDAVVEGPHSSTISHAASSSDAAYNGFSISDVTASVGDSPNVVVAPTSVSVAEGGATDSYDVVLSSEPGDTVTVTAATDGQVGAVPGELVFGTGDWAITQTVTVSAVDDDVDEGVGTHSSVINHTAASNDGGYNGITIDAVSASIGDNDTAGISVSPTSISLAEAAITETQVYSIVLITEPTDPVTLTITTDGETNVNPTQVSFTAGTWAVTQTVTVTVVDDASIEGPHNGVISHTAASTDLNYDEFIINDVIATILDNDGVFQKVTEAISYTLVYGLYIPTNADYNEDEDSPDYHIDNSASIGTFDRVAYYMEFDNTWVYASMPAFTSTVAHIGLPVQDLGVTIAYTTTDMNIHSNYGNPQFNAEGVFGNIEFWSRAYSTTTNPDIMDEWGGDIGLDSEFDINDSVITTTGAYSGSFQIHRPLAGEPSSASTLMAWNNWDSPAVDDLGFDVGSTPDWTGDANAASYTTRTLYVLVRETGGGMLRRPGSSIAENPALPRSQSDAETDSAVRMPDTQTGLAELGWAENPSTPLAIETDSVELARSQAISDMLEAIQSRPVATEMKRQSGNLHYTLTGNPRSRVIYRPADVSVGVSSVLTPTFPAALSSTATIDVGGFIASEQEVSALDVTIDGTSIYSLTYGAGITETTWSTTWTPPGEGIYELEAALTNGSATVITDSTETLFYVDLTPPDVSLDTPHINAQNFRPGQIVIAGTATDTIGIVQVQAKVNGDEWQTANLATTPEGSTVQGTYTATLGLGTTDVPTDTSYVVNVRVTDRGGHQDSLQSTLPADAVAPSLTGLVLTADGQPVGQNDTVNWAQNPDLTLTWDAASDPNGISGYRVEWMEHLSDTVNLLQSTDLPNSATSDSFTAAEAQKLSVRLTATDGLENARSQTFGPFYVDYTTTPVYVDAATLGHYQGWLADSCNLLGLDNRLAQSGSSSLDEQQFYSSWNADGLRLAWSGANWGTDGDLFIYLDTTVGGSTVAYNPYPASQVSVAIFLPTDLGSNTQMAADYLVWVQNKATASLLSWDGSQWVEVVGDWGYAFDANRATPQTDLYLPFDTMSITNPVTQSLGLVALASDEDALKLWATSPADNNLSSARAIGALASNDVEAFTLLKAYRWDSLDSGVCPADGQFNGADLAATVRADSAGVGYGLFSHQLIAAHRQLFPTAAPWADAIDALCSGVAISEWRAYPNRAVSSEPIPLPALCQRDPLGNTPGFLNPRQSLGHLFSTAHPPVADGDTLTVTLRVANYGLSAAQNVTVTLVAEHLLTLAGGQPERTINLGSLAAGESVELDVQATVDIGVNPGQSDGWTHLKAIVFDESGDRYHPAEELHLNHEVDEAGPDYVEIQGPLSLTGPYTQTLWGFVSDQSAVPTITLKIDGQEQTCQNNSSTSQWSCTVDMGDHDDGDIVDLRVQAIDQHGFASDWFTGTSLVVDTPPPTLTLGAVTSYTFDGGLAGPDDTLLSGLLADNRLVSWVEVCEGGACSPASTLIDPDTLSQTLYVYQDDPDAPMMVGPSNDCTSGTPISRTFHITDDFDIADLDVGLNLEHPFRNDVQVWLESPDGTQVQIISRTAAAANLDVQFNDASLASVTMFDDSLGHNVAAPFYDEQRRPHADLLYDFRGESAAGDWTLRICDQYPSEDEGLYYRSQLIFRAAIAPADTEANWQYRLILPQNVDQVTKTLTLYGYDSLGNRSEPITLTFEVDTLPPVVSVSSVHESGEQGDPFTASGLVEDANDVVLRLVIRTPNGQFIADRIDLTGNSWSYSNAVKFWRAGNYQVWVEAEDRAGNVTIAGSYQVERVVPAPPQPPVPVGGYTEPMNLPPLLWLLILLAAAVVAGASAAMARKRRAT